MLKLPIYVKAAVREWDLEIVKLAGGFFRVGTPIPNQMYRVYGTYWNKELAFRRVRQIENSRMKLK